MVRGILLLILLGSSAGCRLGRDPAALRGVWQNEQSRLEFLAGGIFRLHSATGVQTGAYQQVSPSEIRVDIGSRWPSGEPQHWWAMVDGDQLGLCEIRNGRHCLRFARPVLPIAVAPR